MPMSKEFTTMAIRKTVKYQFLQLLAERGYTCLDDFARAELRSAGKDVSVDKERPGRDLNPGRNRDRVPS